VNVQGIVTIIGSVSNVSVAPSKFSTML
jgi:hypothetical protein